MLKTFICEYKVIDEDIEQGFKNGKTFSSEEGGEHTRPFVLGGRRRPMLDKVFIDYCIKNDITFASDKEKEKQFSLFLQKFTYGQMIQGDHLAII
jgi:hypothetical protein